MKKFFEKVIIKGIVITGSLLAVRVVAFFLYKEMAKEGIEMDI